MFPPHAASSHILYRTEPTLPRVREGEEPEKDVANITDGVHLSRAACTGADAVDAKRAASKGKRTRGSSLSSVSEHDEELAAAKGPRRTGSERLTHVSEVCAFVH